jgi:hypothetical protein
VVLHALEQVAQAHGVLVALHVDAIEGDGALVGVLQGGDGPHQGRVAGPVGSEQSEQSFRNVERDVVDRAHAVGVGLRQIVDGQHGLPRQDGPAHSAPSWNGIMLVPLDVHGHVRQVMG